MSQRGSINSLERTSRPKKESLPYKDPTFKSYIKKGSPSYLGVQTMEQNGGIYTLTVIFYVGIIHEIQAHAPLQFYQDFMTFSPSDSPVFVSTHNFDDTLSYISEEIATHYIKYTTDTDFKTLE